MQAINWFPDTHFQSIPFDGLRMANSIAAFDPRALSTGNELVVLADDANLNSTTQIDSIGDHGVQFSGICTALADMAPNAHLEVNALASILGRCKKSIQRAVRRGELPQPFTLLGRHVWMAGKIVEHLQNRQDEVLRLAERRARKIDDQKKGV